MARLGRSDLDVFGVCLGGNVFGWTADEAQSFEVLDAYAAAGGNFIDSSDSYSAFAPGNVGGESETVLGNWFAARGNRSEIVLATKVGRKPDRQGLTRSNGQAHRRLELQRPTAGRGARDLRPGGNRALRRAPTALQPGRAPPVRG